jgi:flagellin-like hook-associated protein FlgL
MRVSNFSSFNYNIPQQKQKIADIQRDIEHDGIEYDGFNGIRNTMAKLHRDDNVSMLTSQMKSLESIKHNMNLYDINQQSMKESLDKFRELMIKKENGSLTPEGIEAINSEMSVIVEYIESLENENLNEDEKLFENKTELVIGDNHRMTRSYPDDAINVNFKKISENLKDIIDNNDFDTMKHLQNKIDMNLVTVGMNTTIANNQIAYKDLQKSYEDKYMSSLGSLEDKIMEFNEAIKNYEASMLMINKVKDLSLVNYLT